MNKLTKIVIAVIIVLSIIIVFITQNKNNNTNTYHDELIMYADFEDNLFITYYDEGTITLKKYNDDKSLAFKAVAKIDGDYYKSLKSLEMKKSNFGSKRKIYMSFHKVGDGSGLYSKTTYEQLKFWINVMHALKKESSFPNEIKLELDRYIDKIELSG